MDSNEYNRESMRSNGQREANLQQQQPVAQISSNPFVTQQQTSEQRLQTDSSPQEQAYHVHHPQQIYSEDVVETQTFPSAQMPVFSKVKQQTAAANHLETEPYKKILSRNSQQQAQPSNQQPQNFTRYHDPARHHNDPSFYDDFNSYRRQSYYQGPKVDQGKLMVIRDYSKQPHQHPKQACNCQHDEFGEHEGVEPADVSIKSGYVSQVAKIWDDRMKNNQGSVRKHQKDIKGLNTIV